MNASVDILLYLDSFRNIDVFLQGLYYLEIKFSNNAVPYYYDSTALNKRFHNLHPPQILDNVYTTKIFMLKYAEEVIKISEIVIFRAEIDAFEEKEILLSVDLMFTDLQGDLSPNSVQNYLNSPPSTSLFNRVGEAVFTISNLMNGINQMIFVTFLDTFSSSLRAAVHAFPVNYKIPEDFTETLFPRSAELILKEKIDNVYDTYAVPLGVCYNKLQEFLNTSLLTKISLPLFSHSDTDFIYNILNRTLYSDCIGTKDKIEAANAIVTELQEMAAKIISLKHEFLDTLRKNPDKVVAKLMKNYITLMDDR